MKHVLFVVIMILHMMAFSQSNSNVITTDLNNYLQQSSVGELIPINIILADKYPSDELIKKSSKLNHEEKRSYVISELKQFSNSSQASLKNFLSEKAKNQHVVSEHYFWITNVISCKATKEVILELDKRNDIEVIDLDEIRPMLIGEFDSEPADLGSTSDITSISGDKGVAEITPNVAKVNAPAVWDLGFTGQGVIVAVLDVGVNYNHVDLADHMWEDTNYPYHGYDFAYNDNDPMDNHGHGTHCAGTVAGDGTAGSQTGVAPDAIIMALKVLNDAGGGTESDSWEAIEFATDNGADILSMSIGWMHAYNPQRATWRNTLDNALAAGVVAAIAAGNEGGSPSNPDDVRTPGDCPPPWLNPDQTLIGGISACVCVGATDNNDNLASFSARGPSSWETISPYNDYPFNPEQGLLRPDVCAPGVSVKSCNAFNINGYTSMSGTSMATPGVAGVMALLMSKVPSLTPQSIDIALETTAVDLGASGKDNLYGAGRVDALEAINNLVEVIAPMNLQISTDQETGVATLGWLHNGGIGFQYFKIYRDGVEIDTTSSLNYIDQLPSYAYYDFEVTAFYGGTDESEAVSNQTQWGSSTVEIYPLDVMSVVYPESTSSTEIIIKNSGILYLTYSLSPFFKNTAVADWITIDPDNAIIQPNDSLTVTLTFDAAGYPQGVYDETLNIVTNDLETPNVYIDVTMIVSDLSLSVEADQSTICSNESTQLHATVSGGSGSYEYSWTSIPEGFTSSEQNPVVSPSETTDYFVSVYDGIATMNNQITITVNELPLVDLGEDEVLCGINQIDLDAGNPGDTYLWSTGETAQSIVGTGSGETLFWAEVTNENGCKGYDSVYINFADVPVVELGADTSTCGGATIILNAGNPGSTYLWSNLETSQSIDVDTIGHGYGEQEFSVLVTNQAGCENTGNIIVEFVDCTSIDELNSFDFRVYPNPSNGLVTIQLNNKLNNNIDITISDQSGKIVYKENNFSMYGEQNKTIDITSLSEGTYIISIVNQSVTKSARIVLQK